MNLVFLISTLYPGRFGYLAATHSSQRGHIDITDHYYLLIYLLVPTSYNHSESSIENKNTLHYRTE